MKSRFLNNSPITQLIEDDSRVGSYPSILRSGDDRRLGDASITYDDSNIKIYTSQDVLLPYNISKNDAAASRFLTGTINFTKNAEKSTQYLGKFTDESIEPYNESRNPSAFFGSGSVNYAGFNPVIYPGFESPIVDKIAIPIDIGVISEQEIKLNFDTKDNTTNSTFVYYNFSTKEWDEIGPTDPALGISTNYANALDGGTKTAGGKTYLTASSGFERIVKQFTSSPGIGREISGQTAIETTGYYKIGYPTSLFEGPNAPRYHANKNQTLKLSNYIKHPFALEKIEIQMSVQGVRKQGASGTGAIAKGFGRDIDNHVFFVYRQTRSNATLDSVNDVSSSVRALIGNESFCFYNKASMPQSGSAFVRYDPVHENQSQVNYGMAANDYSTTVTKDATLDMVFRPRIYDEQFTGASAITFIANRYDSSIDFWNNAYAINFWSGGTVSELYDNVSSLHSTNIANRTARSLQRNTRVQPENRKLITTKHPIDQRPLNSSTWESGVTNVASNNTYYAKLSAPATYFDVTTNVDTTYKEALYLLFPEDELVFGIDAGFYPTLANDTSLGIASDLPDGYEDLAGNNTNSSLKIPPGTARVILYGSLIRNGKELLPSLNQNLTSNAIHEDIHEIITDQFQIEQNSIYSGSYIDNYVTGTMGSDTNPRGVVSRSTSATSRNNRQLTRFITPTSMTSKYYDDDYSLSIAFFSFTSKKELTNKFRYDRFGHFRDMLDQSRDSKTYDVSFQQKFTDQVDFSRPSFPVAGNSPTVCMFVSQSSETLVSASFTRSSNLSTEFTCSLPFFEGQTRNREPIVFNNNTPFSPKTIVLNKPSSLLSST